MQIMEFLKKIVRTFHARRRFPRSVIYSGVSVDSASFVGNNAVLFRDVALIDSVVGNYSYIPS